MYDGKVWCDFQTVNGGDFLSRPYSFGFMMNIDWFQPFKHTNYSVGAIYIMVVMDLSSAERFKPENSIICGIILGPKESKKYINSFLSKLVIDIFRDICQCKESSLTHLYLCCIDVCSLRYTGL